METIDTILNNPVELGMRGLIILCITQIPMTARKVSLIDFMVTHVNDYYKKAESVHADSPFRSGEWISRTALFDSGLRILVSRSLIQFKANEDGIYFSSTDLSKPFLDYIESQYKNDYIGALNSISRSVIGQDEEKIYKRLKKRVGEWEIGAINK